MKTLLAAVDFSDASRAVVAHAAEFARAFQARVVLLHVAEPLANFVPVGAAMDIIETAPPAVLLPDLAAQRAQLDRLGAGIERVETLAVVGLIADEILAQARSSGAELILLGSHGHGALHHLFAGSVATGVLKRAQVPVLVVPVGRKAK